MGNNSSSEVNLRKQPGKSPRLSLGSRNSSARLSKRDILVNEISQELQVLQKEIDHYNGFRGTPVYKDMHSRLSAKIQQVQGQLVKTKNPEKQAPYKTLKSEIINLFKQLEDRVEFNERQLDSAAIESHSFIDQTPKLKNKELNKKVVNDTGAGDLDEIEARVRVLGEEIDNAVTLEDKTKYKILEQKLNMLYGDLSKVDPTTKKSGDKKETISKSLMRQGRKLQSFKEKRPQSVIKESNKEEISKKIQKERQMINKIEEELSDIEVKVMTFEDLKSDPKYRELDQTLKDFWGTLSNLTDSSEENRRRKLKTIDLIKKMLQELNRRSDENSTKINHALDKINDIEDDVLSSKNSAENFSGTRNDNDYNQIDQKLRSLWAKLNDIHNNYDAVALRKQEIIEVIQGLLRRLLEIAENNERNITYANVQVLKAKAQAKEDFPKKAPMATPRAAEDAHLVQQIADLQNQWNSLNRAIREDLRQQETKQIFTILKSMHSTIEHKCEVLNDRIKRRSSENRSNENRSSENRSSENRSSDRRHHQQEPVQKITVSQRNINEIMTVQNQNQGEKTKTFRPEDQLIAELALDRALVTLNTIEQDLTILRPKIINPKENLDHTKTELDKLQKNFLDIEGNLNPTLNDRRSQVYTIMRSCYDLYDQAKALGKEKSDDTNKLKAIVETMQKLKKRVDCFSGVYKNVQYNQVEEGLNQCIEELSGIEPHNEKIASTKFQLLRKLERYLQILEERSLKVGSQEDLVDKPEVPPEVVFTKKAAKIVDTLTKMRSALENFEADPNVEEIKSDIEASENLIKTLEPGTTDERKIQEQYQDYLQKLVLYFNSKIEQPDDAPARLLMQCENELTRLKDHVGNMKTIENDGDFERTQLEMDDLLVRIDSVEALSQNDKEFKINLQRDIQALSALLKNKRRSSKRMSQYNDQMNKAKLEEIQEDIGKLADEVHDFSADNYRQRYDQLDEHMTQLFLKIQSYDLEASMRDYLIRQIQANKKQLDLKLADITYDFHNHTTGTEV